MSEPAENDVPLLRPVPARPVNPKLKVGLGGVKVRLGIWSRDYGTGTVVSLSANGAQVYWEQALAGTSTHLLEHQLSYLEEQCERLT